MGSVTTMLSSLHLIYKRNVVDVLWLALFHWSDSLLGAKLMMMKALIIQIIHQVADRLFMENCILNSSRSIQQIKVLLYQECVWAGMLLNCAGGRIKRSTVVHPMANAGNDFALYFFQNHHTICPWGPSGTFSE